MSVHMIEVSEADEAMIEAFVQAGDATATPFGGLVTDESLPVKRFVDAAVAQAMLYVRAWTARQQESTRHA